jgi:hypothetical protein
MAATLRLVHKSIGVEVRRAPYEVIVDGRVAGSVAMNQSIDIPVDPGTHTLRLRSGRNSSRPRQFDVKEGETVAFRATGKAPLPVFLASSRCPASRFRSVAPRPTGGFDRRRPDDLRRD